jgi:hypothetical protein
MKPYIRKYLFLLLTPTLLLIGCRGQQGPTGPEGPQGPQGPSGQEILPTSFEFSADLTEDNDFLVFEDIPAEIDVIISDVMLAYVLEDYIEEDDLEVWRQLPITDFTDDGIRMMNFDFTEVDIQIYLEANYPLGENDEFFDLFFRAVHIPSDFLQQISASDLEAATTPQKLQEMLDVQIIDLGRHK